MRTLTKLLLVAALFVLVGGGVEAGRRIGRRIPVPGLSVGPAVDAAQTVAASLP